MTDQNSIKSDRSGKARRLQARPAGARKIATAKKGIGSYSADDPESGPSGGKTGGKNEVNLDEQMGSNKPRKEGEGELANPDRVQRDLDRYRDEMADDAPGSGTPEDNP
jgi:hypothetical protein